MSPRVHVVVSGLAEGGGALSGAEKQSSLQASNSWSTNSAERLTTKAGGPELEKQGTAPRQPPASLRVCRGSISLVQSRSSALLELFQWSSSRGFVDEFSDTGDEKSLGEHAMREALHYLA